MPGLKLPDYTALGTPEAPHSTNSDATYDATQPAKAMEQMGVTVTGAGNNLQDMVNIAQVNDAMANQLEPKVNAMAQNFYQLQGKQAMDAAPQFTQQMQDTMNNVADTLTGQARTAFMRQAQGKLETENYRASMHAGQQAQKYFTDSSQAVSQNFVNDYSTNLFTDPKSSSDAYNNAMANQALTLQKLGYSQDDPLYKEQMTGMQATLEKARQGAVQDHFLNQPPDLQVKVAMSSPGWPGAETTAQIGHGAPVSNLGGDTVKPYTAQQVSDMQALVAKPSQYDNLFKKYGMEYGVDPQELKLHAAAESTMNPNADNGQAQGLMQLTPATAKSLGVTDPFDPEQSIMGAAKLMQQQSSATGGNTSNADMLYYAGSENKEGPNTKQYAANLAAVRGTSAGTQYAQNDNTINDASSPAAQQPKYLGQPLSYNQASELTKIALANQSQTERLQKSQQEVNDLQIEQGFGPKLDNDTLTAHDVYTSGIAPDKWSKWINQIKDGPQKVDPNSPDVIQQRGILENMKVDDPKGFLSTDLSGYAGKLPATDIEKLQGDQIKMKQGDQSMDAQNKKAKDITDAVADMLPTAWKNNKDEDTAATASAFKGNLISAVNDAQAAGGKPMARDDVRKMASDMLGNVSVKGTLWDSSMPAYQVPAGTAAANIYRGSPSTPYVPEAFRQGFTRAWQTRFGNAPQDSDISSAYLKSVKP